MNELPEFWFDHEKLAVYQDAIAFIAWLQSSWRASWVAVMSKITWTEHQLPSH